MVTSKELENIISPITSEVHFYTEIFILSLDSRHVILPQQTMFFAVKGINHDGHEYLEDCYHKGIRNFVVEQHVSFSKPDINIFIVPDSVKALQNIVVSHRRKFQIPVIGITGSNGKTIVKEWLSQALEVQSNTVKNPGSYNSQVGVPLSVWKMNKYHEIGVFEAGISQMNEMVELEKVIQPTVGILTNIGTAHQEGFASKEEKTKEKIILFKKVDKLIYCTDDTHTDRLIKECLSKKQLLGWSTLGGEGINVQYQKEKGNAILAVFSYNSQNFQVRLPYEDQASKENLTHVMLTLAYLGWGNEEIQLTLASLEHIDMRLQIKEGKRGSELIDDTYTNDMIGVEKALDFQYKQSNKKYKALILSDFPEKGKLAEQHYQALPKLLEDYQITHFFGVGPVFSKYKEFYKETADFFPDTPSLLTYLNSFDVNDYSFLVKGARKFQFENIVHHLERKQHQTVLEINLSALENNLNFYRGKLTSNTKLMVMVKAFGYGSGSMEIAKLLEYNQVDYLGVAYVDEGVELREQSIALPIMVMNPALADLQLCVDYDLEPEIYSLEILYEAISFLKISNQRLSVHLKIETGMHRLGFSEDEVLEVMSIVNDCPALNIKSVFSHLAASDDKNETAFTIQQVVRLNKAYEKIADPKKTRPMKHILNSAGIINYPEYHFDMVRLGIGLYGSDSSGEYQDSLFTVATLKARISQVKKINKGETIGYSRNGKAEDDMTIAVVSIGYADGYDRRFGNGIGEVLVDGKHCPVVGNVCMDMIMVNVSGLNVFEGDEVVIFDQSLHINDLARKINTIPYEILTNVGQRVKRIYFRE